MNKIFQLVLGHKFISSMAIILLILGGYWGIKAWANDDGVRYILAAVERGDLVVTVSASGQVSASNQIDLKPKISGDVIWVGVKSGQFVKAGAIFAQLDAREAQKAVRDAEVNLENSKIALAKIKKPADSLSLLQAENALDETEENLTQAYEDGLNAVADAFLDFPGIVSGLQDILYGHEAGSSSQINMAIYHDMVKAYNDTVTSSKEDAVAAFATAKNSYDESFKVYKTATRFSNETTVENLINQTHSSGKKNAEAVKNADNLLGLVKDELTERGLAVPSILNTHRTTLADYTEKTNGHLKNLLGARDGITNYKRIVLEKTEAVKKLKTGADNLDLAAQELAVRQKENSLLDAKEKLADYYIRAPFEGMVGRLDVEKLDAVSTATIIATLITTQKIAELSLNELDVSKIKLGQKTKLSFDALEDLNLTGTVSELDTLGESDQGVVTYQVKISFDADNELVKTGMSVTADITTEVKQNVLLVPNGAVKTQGNRRYVEVADNLEPVSNRATLAQSAPTAQIASGQSRRQDVEAGLSNDTRTEIVSGLKEGDLIIVRTVGANNNSSNQSSAPSLFSPPGGSRGNIRLQR